MLEKTAYAQPAPPTRITIANFRYSSFFMKILSNVNNKPKNQKLSNSNLEINPNQNKNAIPLKVFSRMDISKAAPYRAKTIAAFSCPYVQKPFWDEKSWKKPLQAFSLGVNPQTPKTTKKERLLFSSPSTFHYF